MEKVYVCPTILYNKFRGLKLKTENIKEKTYLGTTTAINEFLKQNNIDMNCVEWVLEKANEQDWFTQQDLFGKEF